MKRKSIGLVTWLGGPNFGTVLQSYALFRALEDMGCDVTVLVHRTFIYGLKLKLGLKHLYSGSQTARKSALMQKEELRVRELITPLGYSLAKCGKDALVCGSDQMWNTRFNFNPDFFLAGNGPLKIAYAPSVGTSDFAEETKPQVKEYLADFKHVSVREDTGRKAVQRLTGRDDVKVVMDPVFLLGRDGWERFAAKPSGMGKYLLCYLLRDRDDYAEILREAAAKYGAERIVIVSSYENHDLKVDGAEVISDAGPREFVGLIAGAAAVVTDSFHGTAFSIIFNREVMTLKRFDDADKASQNSRIDDLLTSLGVENPIDWTAVNRNLAARVEDSRAWLQNAINDVR